MVVVQLMLLEKIIGSVAVSVVWAFSSKLFQFMKVLLRKLNEISSYTPILIAGFKPALLPSMTLLSKLVLSR